jgi:hypothetical protein
MFINRFARMQIIVGSSWLGMPEGRDENVCRIDINVALWHFFLPAISMLRVAHASYRGGCKECLLWFGKSWGSSLFACSLCAADKSPRLCPPHNRCLSVSIFLNVICHSDLTSSQFPSFTICFILKRTGQKVWSFCLSVLQPWHSLSFGSQ